MVQRMVRVHHVHRRSNSRKTSQRASLLPSLFSLLLFVYYSWSCKRATMLIMARTAARAFPRVVTVITQLVILWKVPSVVNREYNTGIFANWSLPRFSSFFFSAELKNFTAIPLARIFPGREIQSHPIEKSYKVQIAIF